MKGGEDPEREPSNSNSHEGTTVRGSGIKEKRRDKVRAAVSGRAVRREQKHAGEKSRCVSCTLLELSSTMACSRETRLNGHSQMFVVTFE